ncbi:MAG: recombinase family protein [Sphingomonadaceae bacterium]
MAKRSQQDATRISAKRCAIYTRKSTEEGLDQDFNSLDAQREACVAYIQSQRHEGWTLVPEHYDDGGYSGGNMDRPGLKQLLAEVQAGRVDVIVVYKVDRLTRALSDFAKIVDVLDAKGASFVSITQSFNTTTSMGRLTLNVLLSFAQFEREVISERVRDKIAASKKKGMWMGGVVPLGYDVVDRKLVVNEREAETVRYIMRRYLELGSVRDLVEALDQEGIRSKVQANNIARPGGTRFGRGALYHLLQNRLYRGQIVHRDNIYDGEHEAIVPEDPWTEVQTAIANNGVERRTVNNARDLSVLAGMIVDGEGRRMTPSHACKGSLRYRYYVSVNDPTLEEQAPDTAAWRLPALDVERAVRQGLKALCSNPNGLLEHLEPLVGDGAAVARALDKISKLAPAADILPPAQLRSLLMEIGLRLRIGEQASATIDGGLFASYLGFVVPADYVPSNIVLPMVSTMVRRGKELRLVIGQQRDQPRRDDGLVTLMLKADAAHRQLFEQAGELSANPRYSIKHQARMARLAYLAPDIIAAIVDGRQPATLTARQMLRAPEIPLDWDEQRKLFGFA